MLGKNTRKKTSWISSLTSVPSWHGMDNILSSQKGEKSDSTSSMLIFPHTMPAAMLNKENDHWGCSFCLQIFEYCLLVTRTPGTFAHLAADTTGCSCCNGIFPQSYFISSSFFFPILRKFNHQAWLGKKKRRRKKKKKKRKGGIAIISFLGFVLETETAATTLHLCLVILACACKRGEKKKAENYSGIMQ